MVAHYCCSLPLLGSLQPKDGPFITGLPINDAFFLFISLVVLPPGYSTFFHLYKRTSTPGVFCVKDQTGEYIPSYIFRVQVLYQYKARASPIPPGTAYIPHATLSRKNRTGDGDVQLHRGRFVRALPMRTTRTRRLAGDDPCQRRENYNE